MAISILDDYPPGTRCGNTCSCCKAGRRDLGYGRRERVVDLHEHIDYEGHLLICESCVREAAGMLGMIDPEMRDEAVRSMHEVQAAADEALAERDEARRLVDLMRGWDDKHPSACGDVTHTWIMAHLNKLQDHLMGTKVMSHDELRAFLPGPIRPTMPPPSEPIVESPSTMIAALPENPMSKPRRPRAAKNV